MLTDVWHISGLVLLSLLLPAGLYLWQAWRASQEVLSLREFFPLERFLDHKTYGATVLAAGTSLATVLFAIINSVPALGWSLMLAVASYCGSWLILRRLIPRILSANPQNLTLQSFLGEAFHSPLLRKVTLLLTLIGYLNILAMELLVAHRFFEAFFGSWAIGLTLFLAGFMALYALLGGFRAVVRTDRLQLLFIAGGVGALFGTVGYVYLAETLETSTSITQRGLEAFGIWGGTWWFLLGIVLMNLPGPLVDAGTWQRLCSVRDVAAGVAGLGRAAIGFGLLWTAMIMAGLGLWAFLPMKAATAGAPLVFQAMSFLTGSGSLGLILMAVFTAGIFSALISTADSLLILISQMVAIDFRQSDPDQSVKQARLPIIIAGVMGASLGLVGLFEWLDFALIYLILAIFGAQLALLPAVLTALFAPAKSRWRHGPTATVSIVLGYLFAWGGAAWFGLSGNPAAMSLTPLLALATSGFVYMVSIFLKPNPNF